MSAGLSFERLTNTYFTAEPTNPFERPRVDLVRLPPVLENAAIWGSTGRDDAGNVWFGVSANGPNELSAHLVEYDAAADLAVDRGDVFSNLARLGPLRSGEAQVKIHSRILQAGDGHLYFASMNDTHEEGGPVRPPFGSHLWRLRLPERQWEHMFAAAEGLIAVAGGGDYVYALGYPDHRLAQYHVPTGRVQWVTVGSREGHVSRNLLADIRGHAYVPRLRAAGDEPGAALVEFDTALREVAATPLGHYLNGPPAEGHGIIACQSLPNGSILFATDLGRLYRIDPPIRTGVAAVVDLGWFHPKGRAYTPSLFTYSGRDMVVGIGRTTRGPGHYVWLSYDLRMRASFELPLAVPQLRGVALRDVLLYGSQTRDRFGSFYLVGAYNDGHSRPLVLRVRPAEPESAGGRPKSGR
jgi:hypothetical protein